MKSASTIHRCCEITPLLYALQDHQSSVKETEIETCRAGQTQRYAIKYSGYIWIPLKENSRKRRTAAPRFTTVWRNRWSTWPKKTSKVFTVLSKPRNHNPRPTLRCLLHVSKVFCPPFMYLTADFHSQSRPDKASFGSFHSRRSYSNVSTLRSLWNLAW